MSRWPGVLAVAFLSGCSGCEPAGRPPAPQVSIPVAPLELPPRPAEPPAPEARITGVSGKAERLAGGRWTGLAVGDTLRAEDAVRTSERARVDLEIGEGSHVTVTESSEVRVAELSRVLHRLQIRRGRVAVDYAPDGSRVLRVESEDGRSVAETSGARFGVVSTSESFAVATETGAVNLNAGGKTVVVGAGLQAVVSGPGAPGAAEPIPTALLLKVAAALQASGNGLCALVEGTVAPGTELFVDGKRAEVSSDGRFRVPVPRGEGKSAVAVVTRDAAGRTHEERVPCAAGKPAPSEIHELKVEWKD